MKSIFAYRDTCTSTGWRFFTLETREEILRWHRFCDNLAILNQEDPYPYYEDYLRFISEGTIATNGHIPTPPGDLNVILMDLPSSGLNEMDKSFIKIRNNALKRVMELDLDQLDRGAFLELLTTFDKIHQDAQKYRKMTDTLTSLQAFQNNIKDLADQTFGHMRSVLGILNHLKEEVGEMEASILEPEGTNRDKWKYAKEEMGDVLILFLNLLGRMDIQFQEIFQVARDKMKVNRSRSWPDHPDENGKFKHQ